MYACHKWTYEILHVEDPSPFRHIIILQLYNLYRFVPLTSLNGRLDSLDRTTESNRSRAYY